MNTAFEDQVRDVLRDTPEPDWHALRAAVEERAGKKRRARMLRASVGGFAAAAAVAAISVGVANSSLFEGQTALPGGTSMASLDVPESTAFVPGVWLENGDYVLPMAFPDVAPKGEDSPSGLERSLTGQGTLPGGAVVGGTTVASAACQSIGEASQPEPWGSEAWTYRPTAQPKAQVRAGVTVAGWATTTAVRAMQQLDQNSGACTFDQRFRNIGWPGLTSTEGNQFVVDDPRLTEGKRYVAVRRVGDVTVDAWAAGANEQVALATARRLVDDSVAGLLASRALNDPQPATYVWTDKTSKGFPESAQFILPAIDPAPGVAGQPDFTQPNNLGRSALNVVPVYGAQVGDPVHPGSQAISGREAVYSLKSTEFGDHLGAIYTTIVWKSFPDGQKAFAEILADEGTARWTTTPVREAWSGHDDATTLLASQSGQKAPQQIALRLEGNVLISVVAQGETQAQARTIATRLADEAAKNLASFGRGPEGRPGNGK